MGIASVCPDLAQYRKLATGQLASPDKEALLDHLEDCRACGQQLESLTGKDTLVDLIRQARTVGDGQAGQTVARLVERLRELRPSPPSPSPLLTIRCSGCGKSLRVKAGLAGKKVKCPHCQAVLPVPNAPVNSNQESSPTPAPEIGEGVTVAPTGPVGGASVRTAPDTQVGQSQPAGKDQHLCDFLAPAQSPDELGRLGPYRVLKLLGSGGMGVVFQAEDPDLQRLVALKAMLPSLAASDSAKQRFLREARAAAKIKHDHIVTIHQVGEDRGAPYLAMEFLEGEPLDDRLKREGKLPLADVLRIGREMAEGLAAAHARGLIHRDIKPANVWLEASPGRKSGESRVKILDFGLARAADDAANLTQSGAIVGTPAFMAPEQAQGKTVDPRCDLFSLGCVLYRMASGEAPFKGTDMISTLMAVATENPPSPRSLNKELPAELSEFILQLLAKKPQDRPESAHVVAETLERMATDRPASRTAKPKRRPEKAAVPAASSGRRGRHIAVAVLVLALLVPLVYWLGGVIVNLRTPDGVLVVEVNEPGAEVFVDGSKAIVTWDEGRRKAEFKVKPGTAEVQVKVMKEGFEMEGREVTLKMQGRTVFNAKLIPNPSALMKTADGLTPTYKNSLGMEFVLVPKGKSWLGGGGGKFGDKEIDIAQNFYLGKFEVTQEEWQKIMGTNPSHFSRTGLGKDAVKEVSDADLKRFPVEMVSRQDVQSFMKLLNAQAKEAGWMYRLPKEAEWEYACRGGPLSDRFDSTFDFYLEKPTNQLPPDQTNIRESGKARPCKVGSYKPNRLGLYDLNGNVWEWCDDPARTSHSMARGGAFTYVSGDARASNGYPLMPLHRANDLGLRLARVPISKESNATDAAPEDSSRQWWVQDHGYFLRSVGKVWIEKFDDGKGPLNLFHEVQRTNEFVELRHYTVPVTFRLYKDKALIKHDKSDFKQLYAGKWQAMPKEWVDDDNDTEPAAALPFVPLFNGRDLTGWKAPNPEACAWSVEDGVLVGRGKGAGVGAFGHLVTEAADYANFHLRAELMLCEPQSSTMRFRVGPEGDFQSVVSKGYGVHIRGTDQARTDAVQLDMGTVRKFGIYAMGDPIIGHAPAAFLEGGRWFTLEVIAVGNQFRVKIDGQQIVHCQDAENSFSVGRIGLLCRPVSVIRYRKIEIKKLPPTKAADGPKISPPIADGFAPLFNGKDLTGWKTHPAQPGPWRVENGELISPDSGINHLYTERGDFKNFHLRAEIRITDKGGGAICFRSPFGPRRPAKASLWPQGYALAIHGIKEGGVNRTGTLFAGDAVVVATRDSPIPDNDWFILEVIADGNHITAKLNGQPMVDFVDDRRSFTSGHIVLQKHGVTPTIEAFRKIEIKEFTATKTTGPSAPRYKNSLGMDFALIPKGTWWAGGFGGSPGMTEATVAQDFYMGAYEVTQEEWQKVMGKNPSHFARAKVGKEIGDDELKRFPVDSVTWDEAKAFVKLVNEKVKNDATEAGYSYRLPTELQWEYACRGGPMTAKADSAFLYYFEKPWNTISKDQANFAESGWNRPRAVGSYPPNRLGLHDMHGNVWEWCEDHYDAKGARVIRGGGWGATDVGCRAARRNPGAPSVRNEAVGLRLARVPTK